MEKVVLDKVIEWLKNEVEDGQEFVDAQENGEDWVTSDGTDDIYIGRHECAESLLEMIDKWREEEKKNILANHFGSPPKTMTLADVSEERRKNPEKYLSQYTIDEMKKLGLPIRRGK